MFCVCNRRNKLLGEALNARANRSAFRGSATWTWFAESSSKWTIPFAGNHACSLCCARQLFLPRLRPHARTAQQYPLSVRRIVRFPIRRRRRRRLRCAPFSRQLDSFCAPLPIFPSARTRTIALGNNRLCATNECRRRRYCEAVI